MTKKAPPAPPEHLRDSSKHFWNQVLDRYELEAHELKLLTFACEALDRCDVARDAIAKDGAFVKGERGHLVAHPGVKVIKDSQDAFRLILGRLDLRHVGV
jgi:phage terminase small subunit